MAAYTAITLNNNDAKSMTMFFQQQCMCGVYFQQNYVHYVVFVFSNNVYVVFDYAKRNSIHVENVEQGDKNKLASGFKNLFRVVLLENHEQRQVELLFSCKSP